MNILILGGAGFVGNNLVRRCLQDPKNKITVVDSLEPNLKSDIKNLDEVLKAIKFIKGDMRSKKLMKDVVKNQDVIFNCAAQTSHPLSMVDPIFDVKINCIGNLVLLESIRKYNKKVKVIYLSTSTIIGKALSRVVNEKSQENPIDIYSANKGVAEKYYSIYHNAYNLNTLSLRFANLYGPYGKDFPEFGFINYFISLARNDKKITIYGRGTQKRNVMYVEDAVDLLYECANHDSLFTGNEYFAVHKEHYSVLDIAKEITSVFKKGKIVKVKWPEMRKEIEVKTVSINGSKLYKKINWRPKYTFHQGLMKTKEISKNYN
jgi:UDP-glucose 4-epimerase